MVPGSRYSMLVLGWGEWLRLSTMRRPERVEGVFACKFKERHVHKGCRRVRRSQSRR